MEWGFSQLGDERMFIMTHMPVDDPMKISPQDWTRICFVEQPDDHTQYPYADRFLENFETENCYDRFWQGPEVQNKGNDRNGNKQENALWNTDGKAKEESKEWRNTRYTYCNYAFTVVGDCGPFFNWHIRTHFRRHYFYMVLLAHFQRAMLLIFRQQIAEACIGEASPYPRNERKLRERLQQTYSDFLRFVGLYLVPEVSGQLQPRELFRAVQRHLEVDYLQKQTIEEIENAVQFLNALHDQTINWVVYKLTPLALVANMLAFLLDFFVDVDKHWFGRLAEYFPILKVHIGSWWLPYVLTIGAGTGLCLVLWYLLGARLSTRRR
jgi:hypothetical protein